MRTPGELAKAIRVVQANVADGTLRPIEQPGTPPLASVPPDGPWADVISYRFHCVQCGAQFELSAETYHGSGGSWRRRGSAGAVLRGSAPARLVAFESRARYAPDDVLIHAGSGWRYIAIQPFADDHQLLERLHWPADRCRTVDAYWECAGDVYFLQLEGAGVSLRTPGLYYRRGGEDAYAANLVAVVEPGPIVRRAFEAVMNRFAPLLPLLGSAHKLAPLAKTEYVLDGSAFATLEEFSEHFSERVLRDYKWRGNLDAFNDVLRGGFGTPDGGFVLVWRDHALSRSRLGPTMFDLLVEIIRDHGEGGGEAEDGVELVLA
jgi:hypothetical protein